MLQARVLAGTSPICHATGKALKRYTEKPIKAHACRGARDFATTIFYRLGVIAAPTDAAWEAKQAELNQKQG